MTTNDKDLIKTMINQPGWALFKTEMQNNAAVYRFQAIMPSVEEHYRLILFAKAQSIEEMFGLLEEMIK